VSCTHVKHPSLARQKVSFTDVFDEREPEECRILIVAIGMKVLDVIEDVRLRSRIDVDDSAIAKASDMPIVDENDVIACRLAQ